MQHILATATETNKAKAWGADYIRWVDLGGGLSFFYFDYIYIGIVYKDVLEN